MSKHTPGPWSAHKPSAVLGIKTDGRQWYIRAKDCTVACTLDGESEENARLIAAAPDLLEALQRLLPAYREAVKLWDSNHDDAFTVQAHNAIAKAGGAHG